MEFLSSDQIHESAILRAICHSDPSAWCFIPLGRSVISCCSDAFLKLWGLKNTALNSPGRVLSLNSTILTEAFGDVGVDVEFLQQLARGHSETNQSNFVLERNDGLRVRVKWSIVLAQDGLPVGRIVSFRSDLPGIIADEMLARAQEAKSRIGILSEREHEIMDYLYDGHTNKSIAHLTKISEKTVEKHRARIMQKLHAQNTAELVRLVSASRLLESPSQI